MKRQLLLPFLTLSSYFLTPSPSALAQTSTITAIPPRLEISAKPGDVITKELKVVNGSNSLQYYTIVVDDFIVSDKVGTPIPVTTTTSGRWSLKNWLKTPDIVPVDAKSTQTVKLTLNIPANAYPGGHYAMVTYQLSNTKPGDLKTTGSGISQRTGTLLYVTIAGDLKENAQIVLFSTPKFNEFGPIKFDGNVSNSSDTHISPKGEIIIKNFLGQTVTQIPVDTGNIFPDTSRDFSANWATRWGYGRYSATLNLVFGTAGTILTSTIFFWLFPIRLVIYILTVIISVLLIFILLGKKNKHHQEQLEAEVKELKKEIEALEKN